MAIFISPNTYLEVNNAITYPDYFKQITEFVKNKTTSGNDKTPERITATEINLQRMKRIEKEAQLSPQLIGKLQALDHSLLWIVISEAWCGDSAQNLPYINKIAALSNNKIQLKIVYRDENKEFMKHFLTNGTESIPKLICLNAETQEVMATWGPRPARIQEIINNFKKENPQPKHSEIMYHLHLAYFRDKGESLLEELGHLLDQCNLKISSAEISQ